MARGGRGLGDSGRRGRRRAPVRPHAAPRGPTVRAGPSGRCCSRGRRCRAPPAPWRRAARGAELPERRGGGAGAGRALGRLAGRISAAPAATGRGASCDGAPRGSPGARAGASGGRRGCWLWCGSAGGDRRHGRAGCVCGRVRTAPIELSAGGAGLRGGGAGRRGRGCCCCWPAAGPADCSPLKPRCLPARRSAAQHLPGARPGPPCIPPRRGGPPPRLALPPRYATRPTPTRC